MAERPNISELFRRTVQTNIGFYSGLIDLSANYLKNLSSVFDEIPKSSNHAEQATQARTGNTALVLEAQAGETAKAYFLVENQLSRQVPAEIIASPIVDTNGQEIAQQLYFEPSSINLVPGEKILVQVAADINQTLEVGTAYRGNVTVPGLSDAPIAIVIRRQRGTEKDLVSETPKAKKAKRRTTASKKQKAAAAGK